MHVLARGVQVEVFSGATQKSYFFPCNDWLRKTKEQGDKGCRKELLVGASPCGGLRGWGGVGVWGCICGTGLSTSLRTLWSAPDPVITSHVNLEAALQSASMCADQKGLGCCRNMLCMKMPVAYMYRYEGGSRSLCRSPQGKLFQSCRA